VIGGLEPGCDTYSRLQAAARLAPADAVPVWCALLLDDSFEPDENVTAPRARVVDRLVAAGERELAVATLRRAFASGLGPGLRHEVAQVLASLDKDAGVAAMLAFGREHVRHGVWVAEDLVRHGRRTEAGAFLLAAARDPGCLERVRAAGRLVRGDLGHGREAAGILLAQLASDGTEPRGLPAAVLRKHGYDTQVTDALLTAMGSGIARVVLDAVHTLAAAGHARDAEAAVALRRVLDDPAATAEERARAGRLFRA
jgi:hypothetical protein